MPDGQKVLLFLVNISYKNLDGSPYSSKCVYVAQEHGSPGSPMVRLDLLFIVTPKNVLSIFNIYIERCKKLQCLAIMLCNKNSTYVAHGGSCRRPTTPRLVAQTSRETTSTDSDTAYFFIQLLQY